MKYDNIFKVGYYDKTKPYNWAKNIKQFFRNCKYARQRAIRGYSDYDLWFLSDFYLNVLIASLKEFAENTNSYPSNFSTSEFWKQSILNTAKHFERALNEIGNMNDKNIIDAEMKAGLNGLVRIFYYLWE